MTFREIEGMVLNNFLKKFNFIFIKSELNGKTCKIEVMDKFNFKINLNTKSFNAYQKGGRFLVFTQ